MTLACRFYCSVADKGNNEYDFDPDPLSSTTRRPVYHPPEIHQLPITTGVKPTTTAPEEPAATETTNESISEATTM